MGGGGFDIHYGIFRKASDTVYEASKATNARLLTCLDWTLPVTKDSYVLDLGSGHGGISHEVGLSTNIDEISRLSRRFLSMPTYANIILTIFSFDFRYIASCQTTLFQ